MSYLFNFEIIHSHLDEKFAFYKIISYKRSHKCPVALILLENFSNLENGEISLPDFENSPKGSLACWRRSPFYSKCHVTRYKRPLCHQMCKNVEAIRQANWKGCKMGNSGIDSTNDLLFRAWGKGTDTATKLGELNFDQEDKQPRTKVL